MLALRRGAVVQVSRQDIGAGREAAQEAEAGEDGPRYGSTFPGFISPAGSSAFLILRITSSSAPPRQDGII